MPKSAEEALSGMLAEGVSPEDVLSALESKGFQVQPPAGDESYAPGGPGEGPPAIGMAVELTPAGPEEGMEDEEGPPKDKTEQAVSKAFKTHGYK